MSTNETSSNSNVFGKGQILESTLFLPKEKDVLNVILQDEQSYTVEDAKELLVLFLNKEVI
ncbi:hypothetical protein H1230_04660 [Paenibacillus sp. 19GGS1-52]|uniref:hypothetical protein n=1 Tax=Paenibacillus sp. 19GGS1-52 TaxID=2758563 RepID=UPI001EFB74AB|nr:hypothetical protein [Paenibacillus sp. 19GGS1-52]ULO08136.1 hypothetical protein H1230_04660 [Paenibacillus sp. 19GGS1-52]